MSVPLDEMPAPTASPPPSSTLPETPEHRADSARCEVSIPGFDMLGELGRGGMGVVHKVRQHGLNRVAVLKMLLPDRTPSADALARMKVEAESIARLKHPNVVDVYSFGTHDGRPYIVMEFLPGGNLAQRLARGKFSPREAADFVARLADAVEHAHRHGILHRDIKPANILFDDDGTPHLADFGLAKLTDTHDGLTQPGTPHGTPAFMSPEQARGHLDDLGPGTDVFGLGAVLFQLLTHRAPYAGKDTATILRLAETGQFAKPRSLESTIPADLERICLKALAAQPSDRYSSAAAFADDLRSYLARRRRRTIAASAVAASLLVLSMVAAIVYLPLWNQPMTPIVDPGPPAPIMDERLVVRIWSADKSKQGLRLGMDAGALPARPGDQIRAEVRLNQPAHVYLLALDAEGNIQPLYPWHRDVNVLDKTITDAPPELPPQNELIWPSRASAGGLPLDDRSGQETILLLARRTPLPNDVRLADIVGRLPLSPTPLETRETFVMRGSNRGDDAIHIDQHRGFDRNLARIDDPLEQLLVRLQPHFDLVRAVRFAHVGK